jgi:hypothetical protein
MLLEMPSYCNMQSVPALQSISDLSYLSFCYSGSSVTSAFVSLTAAKFKPLTISMSSAALSYTAKMFIPMILYDFCLLPAQFCLSPYQFCNPTHTKTKDENDNKNCTLKPSCCSSQTQKDKLITSMTFIIRTGRLNRELMSQC